MFNKVYYNKFCKVNHILQQSHNHILTDSFLKAYCFFYNIDGSINDTKDLLFTAGFGMNNCPHIMTALQIFNIVQLQNSGFNTQIVLGDFDVMLARNANDSKSIADRYTNFLSKLGYRNTIRNQFDSLEESRNAIWLSSLVDEKDLVDTQEDLLKHYDKDFVMDYKTKLSIMLMVSDLISPLLQKKAKYIVSISGLDESKYCILAEHVRAKMSLSGSIGGVFSKLLAGINGHPKMSKSKYESGVFLNESVDSILQKIHDNETLNIGLLEWVPENMSVEDVIVKLHNAWNN